MIQNRELIGSRVSLTTNSTSRNKITRKPHNANQRSRSKSREDHDRTNYSTQFIKQLSFQESKPTNKEEPTLRKFRNDIAQVNPSRNLLK